MIPAAAKITQPATVAKALVAGAICALSWAAGVIGDGLSWGDVIGIALAALVGYQGVYWAPRNADPR